MDINSLLAPFLPRPGLAAAQMQQVHMYLDLLLKWNEKTNLTSLRRPEEIVTRHFGEAFFLASSLVQEAAVHEAAGQESVPEMGRQPSKSACAFVDIGSGAGFPGIPLKIYAPHLRGTLVESQNKKATFLKEVVRSLKLTDIEVFSGRAEELTPSESRGFGIVTLRAVERFEKVLPVAAGLAGRNGYVALLIGSGKLETARTLLPSFTWEPPRPLPLSHSRVLLIGTPSS